MIQLRIVRILWDGRAIQALMTDGGIHEIASWQDGRPIPGRRLGPAEEFRLLSPCTPTKVLAVGLNYATHAAELGMAIPEEPLFFLKPPSAVIGPGEAIVYPRLSRQVDYEAELAVVIGRRARRVAREEALTYVLGYTCALDVTARDFQRVDGQWTRAKGFDTFCPLGPWIVPGMDPHDLLVECRVNGQVRQRARTSDLIFPVEDLIHRASLVMTLEPGDVLLTGTPSGVGPLRPGDQVEVEIEGIGVLRNFVVDEAP